MMVEKTGLYINLLNLNVGAKEFAGVDWWRWSSLLQVRKEVSTYKYSDVQMSYESNRKVK